MLLAASTVTEDQLKQNVSNVILKVRTGNLRNSLQSRVEQINGQWSATIGSGVRSGGRVPYSDILEDGGTIVPKNRQWLAIPLPDALTTAGVPKFTPDELRKGQGTGYAGSVIIGGIIFGLNFGTSHLKGGSKIRTRMTPLFALKKSVQIPAKQYMTITLQEMRPKILGLMTDALDKALRP